MGKCKVVNASSLEHRECIWNVYPVCEEHARLRQCDAAIRVSHERRGEALTLPSHIVPDDMQEPEAVKEASEEETKTEVTNGKEEAPKEAPKGLPALAPRKKKAAAAEAAKQAEA